ncbi:MFS transporter [Caldicellulosiruptoraceae bacterium PP1]
MKLNSDLTKDKNLLRSLNFVILGISFGVVFFNVTQGSPIAGLAKNVGFGDFLYGLMLALPVLGGVMQVFASYFLEKNRKRKKIFLISGIFHRIPWIFIAFLPLLFNKGSYILLFLLIFLMTFASISSSFTNVAFWSWMGDLIPEQIRGRFFGRRATIFTIVGMITGLAIGRFLDTHNNLYGFMIIFIFAAIMGLFDILAFIFVDDIPMKQQKENLDIVNMFKATLKNNSFKHFMIFFVLWNFGLNVAGPYFNMYMIKDLKMSYFNIIFYTQIISNLATIITIPYVGKIVDRIGNRPMLLLSSSLLCFVPILWCFTNAHNYKYLIAIISILAGILWPIMDMGNNNLILKLSDSNQKSMYVASINLFNAVFGNAIPVILGGFFIEHIAPYIIILFEKVNLHFVNYHMAFLLSGILRFFSMLYLKNKVNEPGAKSLRNEIRNRLSK